MAPPKSETTALRDDAIGLLLEFLYGERASLGRGEQVAEAASSVKGLFTRSFKQDQWDWFLVFVRLGRPARCRSRRLAAVLGDLGRGLRSFDDKLVTEARQVLLREGAVTALRAYQAGPAPVDPGYGFVYVLSTREQPDLLKIGYTDRAVEQRVNEINRATGVVVRMAPVVFGECAARVMSKRRFTPHSMITVFGLTASSSMCRFVRPRRPSTE
jgi:hypothetical protein